ncbi:hypothetical protein Clacol_010134 [Clathrus columnatus]|uniref:Uncharacterized protein n=1 Tax=Clathrus columnatus TaxID=1419009 RepID=A0AAV5AMI1_9AGAM|nr:hypothetical protein Clacol_010134 [Clathrus columnatus]
MRHVTPSLSINPLAMATPSAPRTPTSTRISSHSTPITATSSSLSQSSAQAQRELKQQVRMEYSSQVFGSKQLLSKIFHNTISESKMKAVINDCVERFKSLPTFSSNTANEQLHYIPFVDRLNAVKDSLLHHNCMAESIYRWVRFEVYDRFMAKGVGNDAPLRPDALARVPSQRSSFLGRCGTLRRGEE